VRLDTIPISGPLSRPKGTIAIARNVCSNPSLVTTIGVSPTAALVNGLIITVPPIEDDVWIRWGAALGCTVAGAGLITMRLQEIADAGTVTLKQAAIARGESMSVATAFGPTLRGEWRLGPTDVTKQFYCDAILAREAGSSLAAYLCNSYNYGVGSDVSSSWLAAVVES